MLNAIDIISLSHIILAFGIEIDDLNYLNGVLLSLAN